MKAVQFATYGGPEVLKVAEVEAPHAGPGQVRIAVRAAGVAVGDEGFGSGSGTYAEYAVLSSWALKPAGLSFAEAAGYPVPAETAIRIINQVAVKPGPS